MQGVSRRFAFLIDKIGMVHWYIKAGSQIAYGITWFDEHSINADVLDSDRFSSYIFRPPEARNIHFIP